MPKTSCVMEGVFQGSLVNISFTIENTQMRAWCQKVLRRKARWQAEKSTESKHGGILLEKLTMRMYHHLQQQNMGADDSAEVIEEYSTAGSKSKISQDDVAMAAHLKACADQCNLCEGNRLHADIHKRGLLQRSTLIGNALINAYAKCGAFRAAQQVLAELSLRDVVSWNALIAGFYQHGHGQEALNCLECMQGEGIFPNAVTFLCILKACGSLHTAQKGRDVHAEIARQGLLGKDTALDNALVDMYAKCGAFDQAQQVLDGLTAQNVISWTALITGYVQHGYGDEALDCFEQMRHKGVSPNALTFASILKACGSIKAAEKGESLHGEIVRKGLLGKDIVLGNALVDMYVKCGELFKAQHMFDRLPIQNIVSWNVLIAGYCLHGHGLKALHCYEKMRCKGFSGDTVTLACILNACGSIRAAKKGKEIHAAIVKVGLLEKRNVLGNALVDMYAKCGALAEAQSVFDELAVQDVVSWTALIVGYYQQGRGAEALNCFEQLKRDGLSPDAVTFACILKACGSIGALEKGKEIHSEVVLDGFLGEVTVVGSALVEMYAQCAALTKAQEVFDELPFHNVSSWTALIAGYAQAGRDDIVFDSFNRMLKEGIQPNLVTFFVMLNACNGSGLVNEGQMYLETMILNFGILPTLEHHTCMVHLLARTGRFDKAMAVIEKLPSSHYVPVWHALLSACQPWGNEKLARLAFEHAVRLDEKSAVAYVSISNIYSDAGIHTRLKL